MKAQALQLPIPISDLARILRAHGVKHAQLFGSYARGDQTAGSDLDILVEYKRGASYFDQLDLQAELQKKTGVRVDIISQIHPSFKPYIEPELIDLEI